MIDVNNPPFATGLLTTQPNNPLLDLNAGIGQRATSYRFRLFNGITGESLGDINPLRGATLSHNTSQVIKRQLSFSLGVADSALVDPLSARVEPFMVINDVEWPLGRYLFTDASYQQFTAGNLANLALNDEMFLVDQQITSGVNGNGQGVASVVGDVLKDLPVTFELEASPFLSIQSWTIGSSRGQMLEALALVGDYFDPWFDNTGVLRFIRAFNPALKVPDFNWDNGRPVYQGSSVRSSDVLAAPNRFVVVSNNSSEQTPVTAVADVPITAPNSFANRGFYLPSVHDLQLETNAQAIAVAQNLAQRNTIFETITLQTPPDPRHDSYNVINWQGGNWLELSWSLDMRDGGNMTHVIRKAYM